MEYHLLDTNSKFRTDEAEKDISCQCKKEKCYLLHINFFWVGTLVLLACACSVLACWNFHLNNELSKMRQDVDFLMQRSPPRFTQDFNEPMDDFNNGIDHIETLLEKTLDVSSNEQTEMHSPLSQKVTYPQTKSSHHSVVKRSSDRSHGAPKRRRKKGKGRKKKKFDAKKFLRRGKAIAVHVQAERPSGLPGINPPGRTLTGWKEPDMHYFGFNTDHLLPDGYLTVPATGLYFVYSQVIFQTTDVPHMVAEIGVNALGGATFTKCQVTQGYNSTTGSYVACHSNGVVYLREGDGISLIVNPQNVRVFMAPEYTYFGAFLIGL